MTLREHLKAQVAENPCGWGEAIRPCEPRCSGCRERQRAEVMLASLDESEQQACGSGEGEHPTYSGYRLVEDPSEPFA